jgi:hypothetical protein
MRAPYLSAVLAVALALGSGAALAQTTVEVLDAFRLGCLEQLPDFTGSEVAFRTLGLEGEVTSPASAGGDEYFLGSCRCPDLPGVGLLAQFITRSQYDDPEYKSSASCYVMAGLPVGANIFQELTATATDLSDSNVSRNEDSEGDGKRLVLNWWQGNQLIEILAAQQPDGEVSIMVGAAEVRQ